jgi:CubicO group peptidase (beta-lactamase class C family)
MHTGPARLQLTAAFALAAFGAPRAMTAQTSASTSPRSRAQIQAAIDSIVTAPITAGKLAGASVAVLHGTDTLVLKGYGKADLELNVPTPPDASYEIGSVTKQFTATAILQLAGEGKLSLDDEITKYFPSFPTAGKRITIRQLLGHTSGITEYTNPSNPDFRMLRFLPLRPDSVIDLIGKQPLDFTPGEAMVYSNSGFFIAARIVEKVSGQSYADYIEQNVFAKAGMSNSYYCSEQTIHPNHTHGYDTGSAGMIIKGYVNHTWPFGAGSLCSTAGDMLKWNLALHGGKVLSPAMYQEMITPSQLADGTKQRYGKGISLSDLGGRRAIYHGGAINGYLAESEYFPDDHLVIVVLLNTSGPVSPGGLARQIEDEVLGKRPAPTGSPYQGDLTELAGTYTGPGRGRPTELTVSVQDGKLMLGSPRSSRANPLVHLDGDRFASGTALYTFIRDHGKVVGLHFDAGALNVRLRRS